MANPVKVPQKKRNNNNTTKKKRGLIVILFIFFLAIFYFLFFMNSDNIPKHLEGSWLRSDGSYTIDLAEIQAEGKLTAKYFNPNPIKVGKASWRDQDGNILVYVELRDKNYPGSIYRLTFDENANSLIGTYFQAVSRQTFEVEFKRTKD